MLDFLKDCCNCFLLSLVEKHLNELNVLQCFISYWKKFEKLIKFITQSYLLLLNSFLFLSRFFDSLRSLNNYFLRTFACKSLLNRSSVLINYIMWSSNHFSTSSCFPRCKNLSDIMETWQKLHDHMVSWSRDKWKSLYFLFHEA